MFTLGFLLIGSLLFGQSVYIGDSGKAQLEQYDLNGNLIAIIDDDVNTPRGVSSDGDFLFYVNKDFGQLIRFDLTLNEKTVIKDGLEDPRQVTAINNEDFLIVTEFDGDVSRMNYDGSDYTILTNSISEPLFLSHDPIVERVFITNRTTIYSMNYDGTDIQIVPGSFDDVVAIEVDPRSGSLYFTERGNSNRVSKMQYDGSDREIVLNTPLLISFMDLHCEEDRMYFTSVSDNTFGAFDIDGSNFEVIDISSIVIGGLDLVPNDCDILSSVNEDEEIIDFKVFPNPTIDMVTIEYDNDLVDQIEVIDFQGRIIQRLITNSSTNSIQLDLQEGCYLLKVYSENKFTTKRVIKL